jgi:hypothetical protein
MSGSSVSITRVLEPGSFRFDLRLLLLTSGTQPVEGAPKALEILAILVKNPGDWFLRAIC